MNDGTYTFTDFSRLGACIVSGSSRWYEFHKHRIWNASTQIDKAEVYRVEVDGREIEVLREEAARILERIRLSIALSSLISKKAADKAQLREIIEKEVFGN